MAILAVTNAVLQPDNKTVRLTTASQTDVNYTLTVTDVTTLIGTLIDPAFDEAIIAGDALPRVTSATSLDGTTIEIVFDKPMDPLGGGGIDNIANYTLSGTGQTAGPIVKDHIDIISNTTIELTTTGEMNIGVNNYTVTAANVTDTNGNIIDPAHDEDTFNGIGVSPQVVSATTIDPTHVDVLFDSDVEQTTQEDAGNYTVTGPEPGTVVAAVRQSATVVRLELVFLLGGDYTVTVEHVTDMSGNPVDPAADEATFTITPIWYVKTLYSMPMYPYSMTSNSDGTVLAIATVGAATNGRVYVSTDSGVTWVAQTLAGVTTGDWRSVASDSTGQHLIACNHGTHVFTTTDGGANWTERDPDAAGHVSWTAVASDSTGAKLAACVYGTHVYTSDDSGGTWTERDPTGLGDANWTSVASDSTGEHLIVGRYGGHMYTSINSGVDWTERTAGLVDLDWSSVASDSTGQYLVGCNYAVGGKIIVSTNSGLNWADVAPIPDYWRSVASDGTGQHLIACAENGKVYVSVNGGTNWADQLLGTKAWRAVTSDSTGTNLMACADTGETYLSTDGGTTWEGTLTTAVTTANWQCLGANSTGQYLAAGVFGGRLFLSNDYGTSWLETKPRGNVNANWVSADFSDDGSIIIACDSTLNNNSVYVSINGGDNWTAYDPSAAHADVRWISVACDSTGANMIASSNNIGHVYTSVNTGVAWADKTPAAGGANFWQCVDSDASGSALITCARDIAAAGHVFTSVNGGTAWSERDPAGVGHVAWESVATDSVGTKLIACDGGAAGRVYISVNSGTSWMAQTLAGATTGDWMCVASDSDGSVLLAGDHDLRFYVSVDSGGTWTAQTLPGAVTNEEWFKCACNATGTVRMCCAATDGRVYIYK